MNINMTNNIRKANNSLVTLTLTSGGSVESYPEKKDRLYNKLLHLYYIAGIIF